jgi:hypothetical protein
VVTACVVIVVGAGALLGAVGTALACPFCSAGLWWCFLALCLGGGLTLVEVVVGVDCVVVVLLVAAALWLEVDEDAPHALTINTSKTAPKAIRRCFMDVLPGPPGCGGLPARTPPTAGCFPDLNSR